MAVRIPTLSVATVTNAEGQYSLTVPAARITAGQQVAISAQRVGFASQTRTITLTPGASLTQSFTLAADALQLEEIVATGQGTTTTRERLTTAVNTIRAQEITQSRETNVVAALAGKAPNVQVTSSAGDPGAGAYIQIRGAASVVGGTQPLFVVDGSPIDNSSVQIQGNTTGTVVTNRAADINPNDIADIQILKGGAATALYGSRGANGVVLITTKSGTTGRSRASFQTSYSFDNVNKTVPLQTRFGQGLNCAPLSEPDDPCTVNDVFPSVVTWGAPLGSDVETFDHANEVFKTGNRLENNLTLSGGSDRTTYYLSLGRVGHEGTIVGPQSYDRTTARLKGTHLFTDNFTVGGNIAYTAGQGDFVQQGSNISGIQLGALRTPPEFNNRPYLDPATGLHRSYRVPNPTTLATGRGYDNPFWVANEITNTANVNRSFGNITLDYQPLSWLTANYVLGADYSADERRTVFPKSSSDFPLGRLIRADLVNFQIESRLSATGTANLNENVVGSLTLGQNLNHEEFRRYQVNGANLIFGTEQLDFAVDKDPDEFSSTSRIDGYFANLETTLYDQLTLTGNLLLEGSSTFGGEGKRFLYPGIGASWQFSRLPAFDNLTWLDLGKIRANYGVSGRQPPVFASSDGFVTTNFTDGWLSPNGLQSVYAGKDGVVTQGRLANPDIGPERKKEFEAGFDLGFLGGRAGLGVTYYDRVTEDMILNLPLAPSTGYTSQFRNAARVDNDGIELTMDVVPVRRSNFDWTLNAQYARNRSCVKNLSGTETVFLAGFTGSTVSL
ncbi:MAG: SusC/RagA family TonB-linked outer membrane protein, partial [Chloroflexota bacterium]|nr:SusC/RagA family TonB-linked outer membrane protein [Chloroflexota bacterium]